MHKVAVIGSGPGSFYAADHLLATGNFQVDMFEKEYVPFGLVRFGVAPDHMNIRMVSKAFKKMGSHENLRYFGGVEIGKDIEYSDLSERYDAIILGHGAHNGKQLEIPGEDLEGCHDAISIAGWYNAHPDFEDYKLNLDAKACVVIGHGNVAVDISRVLCSSYDEMAKTDISTHALEQLKDNHIKRVDMIGRRGVAQLSFTIKEALELGKMEVADLVAFKEELIMDEEDKASLEDPHNRYRTRIIDMLKEAANAEYHKDRKLAVRFLWSPVKITGKKQVEGIVLERNQLVTKDGKRTIEATGETIEIPCDMVVRAIGHYGQSISKELPFDPIKGIYPNIDGRLVQSNGDTLAGLYAVGWIKRGPSGTIGLNRPDSIGVANLIIEDAEKGKLNKRQKNDDITTVLDTAGVHYVNFEETISVEEGEIEAAEDDTRKRIPFTKREHQLSYIKSKR